MAVGGFKGFRGFGGFREVMLGDAIGWIRGELVVAGQLPDVVTQFTRQRE